MDGKQDIILAISIIVFLLATVFVALYFISCVFVVRTVRLADWLMLLAWVSLHIMKHFVLLWPFYLMVVDGSFMKMLDFGLMFSLFYATGKGLGRHARFISPENEIGLNKAIYCFQILYVSVHSKFIERYAETA